MYYNETLKEPIIILRELLSGLQPAESNGRLMSPGSAEMLYPR
jgi:hypothetical protein